MKQTTGQKPDYTPINDDEEIMATLQCFLIPKELERVLKKLAAAKGLIGCRCIKGQYELINP